MQLEQSLNAAGCCLVPIITLTAEGVILKKCIAQSSGEVRKSRDMGTATCLKGDPEEPKVKTELCTCVQIIVASLRTYLKLRNRELVALCKWCIVRRDLCKLRPGVVSGACLGQADKPVHCADRVNMAPLLVPIGRLANLPTD
jgi:hypothetical protein